MRLLPDEKEEIRGVAAKWKNQYPDTKLEIYQRLLTLSEHSTRADVAAIIGNDSWIGEDCTECRGRAVVLVGQEPDYESHTVWLCAACVEKLGQLITLVK